MTEAPTGRELQALAVSAHAHGSEVEAFAELFHDASEVLAGTRRWAVVCADNAEVLPRMPAKSVAHVITDPPYDAATHANALCGSIGDYGRHAQTGVSFGCLDNPGEVATALLRVALRWCVAFCALEQLGAYQRGAGPLWIRAGIWDKINPTPQLTGDRPAQAAEGLAIMHASGPKRWSRGGGAGIWRCRPEHGDDRPAHPTPKPIALMLDLVADFTDPGDVVLDPFAGSGTTGVACLRLGRRFIGVERDAAYAQVARERLEAEARGLSVADVRAGQASLFDEGGAP